MTPAAPALTAPVPGLGRVHPELAATLAGLPELPGPFTDIAAAREGFRSLMAPLAPTTEDPVHVSPATISGPEGNPIDIQVVRPAEPAGTALPAVLYLHGGYVALGELDGPSPMAPYGERGVRFRGGREAVEAGLGCQGLLDRSPAHTLKRNSTIRL